ncbi:hypothetical protein CHL76_15100 [Marinococcus halophilus]|uniref:Putative HTH-type transcriptional regulator YxaD n=1 Tax=Marinococcus halophilus TaxID=1371 RepID=A0A510Y9D7_MARHA|nr:MarR family transcriptional regulator [Marinococcus halophilus]OZT79008.1 hypothetical protein CHL76_15100 [Marinococcus halophilus]GEK60006.1 putative HTH-type transcriptional regulator YxaD [Marinococcus halophilus]
MNKHDKEMLELIETGVVTLMRRADFKRTLDSQANSLDRSAYLILQVLHQQSPRSARELADHFLLDISTLSRQIHSLEKKGLVSRRPDHHDKRVNQIFITGEGIEAINTLKQERIHMYANLLADWEKEDRDQFAQLLERFNNTLVQKRGLPSS